MIKKINDWDEVDKSLKEIAEITRVVITEENHLNKNIDDLKMVSNAKLQPLLARKAELEKMLKKYVIGQKEKEFAHKRSRELTFGIVGFRKSSSVVYDNAKEVLSMLQELGMKACYKITERIDKNELGKYKDSVLAKVGARRQEKDEFYYTIKAEEVKDSI